MRTESSRLAAGSFRALRSLRISPDPNAICSDHLLPSLVSDLRAGDAAAAARAAMTLRLLTRHSPDNRLKIAAAGAVPALTALLSAADPVVQEHAATALFNLSLCDANLPAIAAAGAVAALVDGPLRGGSDAAREGAACALLRLARSGEAGAIARSGAVELLVDLLETGRPRGRKDAAAALYEMFAAAGENAGRAVEAGAARVLVEIMAEPELGMVDKAAFLLAVLVRAAGAPAAAAAAAEGGIPVLVEVLECGTPQQKQIVADVLLAMCSHSEEHALEVTREGGLPLLVALSHSGSGNCRQKTKTLVKLLRRAIIMWEHCQRSSDHTCMSV